MTASNRSRYTVLFIAGSGRCGSTLLDLVLSGHPEILACGELVTINCPSRPIDATDSSSPGFDEVRAEFWTSVYERYSRRTGSDLADVTFTQPRWLQLLTSRGTWLSSWRKRNLALYDALQQESGTPVITDASKMMQRLYLVQQLEEIDVRVIHLMRDGRAVAFSYLRRYGSFVAGLRMWLSSSIAAAILRRRFSRDRWLSVRYEDLASEPIAVASQVCAFLGLRFDPKMINQSHHAYIGVGGNPGTRRRAGEAIRLDEQWKTSMRPRHRLLFALAAGWLNRSYGYR